MVSQWSVLTNFSVAFLAKAQAVGTKRDASGVETGQSIRLDLGRLTEYDRKKPPSVRQPNIGRPL